MTWEEISKELFEKRTAKRFKFNGATNCIEYNGKSILLDSYGEDIEELLNEQHETIERLKQNINELMCVNVEEDLLKENEQLKSENRKLNERIGILEGSLIDKGFDIND